MSNSFESRALGREVADDPGDFLAPLVQFVHDADVLPVFDLGDELESFRAQYGDEAAQMAEQAYWNMNKESK